MNQDHLRQELLTKRKMMLNEDVLRKSKSIAQTMINHDLFQNSACCLYYYPIHNEVDVRSVVEYAWKKGKEVLFPRIEGDTLSFFAVTNFNGFQPGPFGIPEPQPKNWQPENCFPVDLGRIDLIIVPGIAFDLQGYRLGYGKGYYDRLLRKAPASTIGIAYDFQIVDTIYPQEHDVPVQQIITETRLINCS